MEAKRGYRKSFTQNIRQLFIYFEFRLNFLDGFETPEMSWKGKVSFGLIHDDDPGSFIAVIKDKHKHKQAVES